MVDAIICAHHTHSSTCLFPRSWLIPLQGSHFQNPVRKGCFIQQILQELIRRGFFSLYLLIPKKEWGIYLVLDPGGSDRLPQVQVVMFASIVPAPLALSLQNAYFFITTQHAPGDLPEARSGTKTHLWKGIVTQTLLQTFILCKIPGCGGCVHLSESSQGWVGFNHVITRLMGLQQSPSQGA